MAVSFAHSLRDSALERAVSAFEPGQVRSDYQHRDKRLTPGEILAPPGALLKWYDLAPLDAAISPDMQRLARAFIVEEARAGRIALRGDLGFVVLHRCGADFYFLLLSTWRNENELWETVYAKNGAAAPDFALFPLPGPHRGTYCVWELGAVWHEQQAWRRYLLSARDDAARLAYLQDHVDGAV